MIGILNIMRREKERRVRAQEEKLFRKCSTFFFFFLNKVFIFLYYTNNRKNVQLFFQHLWERRTLPTFVVFNSTLILMVSSLEKNALLKALIIE